MRESTASLMIKHLYKKGAKINYYDPSGIKYEFKSLKNVSFCHNIKKACLERDLVIIHTEWEEFKAIDFKKLFKNKKIKIFDMRNLYSTSFMKKQGILYYSIGR